MDPKSLLYSETHEWVESSGDAVAVGISDHAQHLLGDIVFVELPAVGRTVAKGEEMMTIESPKAAASVYAPVSGEIVAVNDNLDASPDTINQSPYADGWIVRIKPSNFAAEKGSLLDHAAYEAKVNEA
jgi:glycine cleavage system H protein